MDRHLIDIDVNPVTFGWNDFRKLGSIAGKNRRHLIGSDVTRLGNIDDQVGHAEGKHRQHDEQRGGRGQPTTHAPTGEPLLPIRLRGWLVTAVARPLRGRLGWWFGRRCRSGFRGRPVKGRLDRLNLLALCRRRGVIRHR
jgi:hypothetical protein